MRNGNDIVISNTRLKGGLSKSQSNQHGGGISSLHIHNLWNFILRPNKFFIQYSDVITLEIILGVFFLHIN